MEKLLFEAKKKHLSVTVCEFETSWEIRNPDNL